MNFGFILVIHSLVENFNINFKRFYFRRGDKEIFSLMITQN